MQTNTYKKIFTLIYLTIFLFGIFTPLSQSFAQAIKSIKITTNNTGSVKTGDIVTIVAETFGATKSEEVRFYSWPKVEGFDSVAKCTTRNNPTNITIRFCWVEFNSSTNGTYTINASFTEDGQTYQSNTLRVVVESPTIKTSSLTSTSVTLAAEKLAKNSDIIFNVDNADSLTPSYHKEQSVKSDNYGKATSQSFDGLNPNGKYIAKVRINTSLQAKINFTTPTSTPNSPLTILASSGSIKPDENTVITAKVEDLSTFPTSKEVRFYSWPKVEGFDSVAKCPTSRFNVSGTIWTCTVNFKSSIKEPTAYIINASFTEDNKTYQAKEITIEVKDTPNILEQENSAAVTDTTYTPLAPLPGLDKTIDTKISKDNSNPCPFGNYLNIIIKLVLGIAAVLAMVMIIMGGIEYITSDLVSSKEEGKERILHAVLGLVIALGAYLILNTINPNLLSACLNKLPEAKITIIENFEASGALTFDGKPIRVNFNKEAYPAAKIAEQKTGVSKSLILAIFAQETNNGSNTGGCNYTNANMSPSELIALKEITSDWATVKVSCSGGGSSHGGAIGLTQFLPSTWKQFRGEAEKLLGHKPNAWNVGDALMMTALKLKSNNGINNPEEAACKYFGSCAITISCGNNKTGTYGQCVMGKKLSIEQQIADAIKKGEIS